MPNYDADWDNYEGNESSVKLDGTSIYLFQNERYNNTAAGWVLRTRVDVPDLRALGHGWDNDFSSLRNASNYAVTVYDGVNYQGHYFTITPLMDYPGLSNRLISSAYGTLTTPTVNDIVGPEVRFDWNDAISSLKFER